MLIKTKLRDFTAEAMGMFLQVLARALTAVRGFWIGIEPTDKRRIYFANHTSNGDFILVWTSLPKPIRDKTRAVAASDYWFKNKLRRFIGEHVVKAVLINRDPETRSADEDPVQMMSNALSEGSSLIIFPEGRRNQDETERLLSFKTGLYHVLKSNPDVEAVPTWIENLNRVLPRGSLIPIPLICTVTFGPPITLNDKEGKDAFLKRAEDALLNVADMVEQGVIHVR